MYKVKEIFKSIQGEGYNSEGFSFCKIFWV